MSALSIEARKACRGSRASGAPTAPTNPSVLGKSRIAPAAAPSSGVIQGCTTQALGWSSTVKVSSEPVPKLSMRLQPTEAPIEWPTRS